MSPTSTICAVCGGVRLSRWAWFLSGEGLCGHCWDWVRAIVRKAVRRRRERAL